MGEQKDIVLDEKTKKMITSLLSQIKMFEGQIDSILQTVVNTKFPESEDRYEITDDLSTLKVIKLS